VFEDVDRGRMMPIDPPSQRARRIELHGIKASRDSLWAGRQADAERIAERMGWIGRHDEGGTAAGFREGVGGRAGGLADTAFAAIEMKHRQSQNFNF
jgi:hypothetical protein